MRNLSALVIASFIVAAPTAQAEDGAERYNHMLDRISGQTSNNDTEQQAETAKLEEHATS